jgi:hypothetical protein
MCPGEKSFLDKIFLFSVCVLVFFTMQLFKKIFLILTGSCVAFFFFSDSVFSDSIQDTLELRVDIAPIFKLSLETQIDPAAVSYSGTDLLEPSKNSVLAGKKLNGTIALGHLLARKQNNQALPLISEYKVLMNIHCESNHNKAYVLTQKLDMPLTGLSTHALFPETAFVCQASRDNVLNFKSGALFLQEETSLRPGELQTIYRSGESGRDSLEAFINLWYWVSDLQAEKVLPSQQSDTYQSTITITMVEL